MSRFDRNDPEIRLNQTPTFELTPVEKPDMSPFLVHMTGRNAIHSILRGEGAERDLPAATGILRSTEPESNWNGQLPRVVCFTESPIFALDFFRHRSPRRASEDQRYGVGFDKARLVARGVRPAVYFDRALHGHYLQVARGLQVEDATPTEELPAHLAALIEGLRRLVGGLHPLRVPLGETFTRQGFTWEREWRYPSPDGLEFSHADIRVICCPPEEQASIEHILGPEAGRIQFVHAWQEFDDVTSFLERRERAVALRSDRVARARSDREKLNAKRALLAEYEAADASLERYEQALGRLVRELESVAAKRAEIATEAERVRVEIARLSPAASPAEDEAPEAGRVHFETRLQGREAIARMDAEELVRYINSFDEDDRPSMSTSDPVDMLRAWARDLMEADVYDPEEEALNEYLRMLHHPGHE